MKFVFELIGTFFLVFTVGMTVLEPASAGSLAPLAIASALVVMIYAGGHVSGAHYNPAVSWAVFLRRKIGLLEMFLYWAAQLIGATFAAYMAIYLKGDVARAVMVFDIERVMLAEFLFTFALVLVVLHVAVAKKSAGNSYFGLAIGLVIVAGAYSVGPISGGAFNPAVALGAAIMNLGSLSNLWVYLVANLLGATAAAVVFRFTEA